MVQRRGPNRFKRGLGRFLQELGGGITDIWAQAPARQALLLQNQKTMREQEAARKYQELLPGLLGQPEQPPPVRRQELPEQVVAPPPELPTPVRRRELPEQVGAPPPVAPFRVTPQSLRDTAARMKPEERVGSGVLTDTPPDPRGGLTLSDRMAYDLMRTPRELPPLSQGAAPSVRGAPDPVTPPTPIPLGWEAAPTPTPTAAPAPTAPARPPTAPAAVAPAPAPAPPRYDAEKTLYTPPSEPGPQWSPEVMQLRRLGRLAGYDQAQIDADLASVKPLPKWTEYHQARALAEQAAAPGAFTEAEVIDQYGSPTKEYYNSVIRQNPWLFDWMSTQGEYAPRMDTLFPWISKYREGHQPGLGQDIDDDKLLTGKDMERLIDFTRFYPGDVDETTGVPAKLRRTELSDEAISTLATLPNIVQNVEEMFNMAEELNKGNTSRFMGLFSSRFDRILAAFGNLEAENRAREADGFSGMMQFVIDNATTDESIDSAMQETLDEYNRGGNTPLTPEEVGNISDYVRGLLSLRMGLAGPIARSVTGEVGVLTDADVQRAQQLLPQMGETAGQTAQKKNTIYRNMLGMFNAAYFGPMHGAQQVWDILNSPPTQSLSTGSGGSIEENFIPVQN